MYSKNQLQIQTKFWKKIMISFLNDTYANRALQCFYVRISSNGCWGTWGNCTHHWDSSKSAHLLVLLFQLYSLFTILLETTSTLNSFVDRFIVNLLFVVYVGEQVIRSDVAILLINFFLRVEGCWCVFVKIVLQILWELGLFFGGPFADSPCGESEMRCQSRNFLKKAWTLRDCFQNFQIKIVSLSSPWWRSRA